MKFTGLIVFGLLLQLLSFNTASYAHAEKDQCSSGDQHHFLVVQNYGVIRLFSENEDFKLRRQPISFYYKGAGHVAIGTDVQSNYKYSGPKKESCPLRYRLCVLRL
jgi:hypothetical protein